MTEKKIIETVFEKALIPLYPMISHFDIIGNGLPEGNFYKKYTIILVLPTIYYEMSFISRIGEDIKLILHMIGLDKLEIGFEGTKRGVFIIRTSIY